LQRDELFFGKATLAFLGNPHAESKLIDNGA
jgi:hypothetical protein